MKSAVRYFALTNDNDKVIGLGKMVYNESGLCGYLLYEGQWIEERVILECLFDQTAGEEVDELEASQIAVALGGKL